MELGLQGRNVLVLSSTAGLGRAVAASLAAEGANTVVTGRDAERAADTAAHLPRAVPLAGDLREPDVPARLVREAADRLGGLDGLVVNTGGARPGGLLETDPDDEDAAFRALLRPATAAARAAVPLLRRSVAGRMVFIAARSALETTPELALSGTFRSGVVAAARSLAAELAPDVLVNVVVPGQFDTTGLRRFESSLAERTGKGTADVRQRHVDAIPMGRVGRPSELADMVAFLCGNRASYITGSVIRIDGGAARSH